MTVEAASVAAETHVLVFGCPRRQRTFRALASGPPPHHTAAPVVTIPTCPGCGGEHTVLDLYGRARRHGEAVDVTLAAEAPSPSSSSAAPSPAPRRVTTDAILAAVPIEDTPAAEVAAALGYATTPSLLQRIGRSPSLQRQIVITRASGGPGRHTLIRRA
jgi:hypothetical protein